MRTLPLFFLFLLISLSIQAVDMQPYLQTPTPTSMYVCWHASSGTESKVEYGTTNALGSSATGSLYSFSSSVKWHWVKLTGLQPDTEYFYQCHTGSQESSIYAFRTPPAIGDRTGHYRFLIMSDSQENTSTSSSIVLKVVQKLTELYGTNWHNEVDLCCHVGDTVFWGILLAPYMNEHFTPFAPLSSSIPIMIATGNHEFENSYFYNYRKVEDIGGSEGEKYFSFDVGTIRFLFLNTNITTTTETGWMQTKITEAQSNSNLDFIFSFAHAPAYSEIWPDGNSSWMQSTVLPSLAAASKATLVAGGHTHAYERGVYPDGNLTTIIAGGSGGTLDRWGMYSNQTDYNNTIKSLDQYHFILVDVDLADRSYIATMYGLGNSDKVRDNEIEDQWSFSSNIPAENPPFAEAQSAATGGLMKLTACPANHSYTQMSTRYQVSSNPGFTSTVVDVTRQKMDVYDDTGSPLWQPIDVNSSLDIWRYQVAAGVLTVGNTYYWRIKSRDTYTKWSDWSTPSSFVMQTQNPAADFMIHNPVVDINEAVYFVDTSIGTPTSYSWDFNGDSISDSNLREPSWSYVTGGIKDITLSVIINGLPYSITKQVTVNGGTLPEPQNIKIRIDSDSINITWDPVQGATVYRIFYFSNPEVLSITNWIDTFETHLSISLSDRPRAQFYCVVAKSEWRKQ